MKDKREDLLALTNWNFSMPSASSLPDTDEELPERDMCAYDPSIPPNIQLHLKLLWPIPLAQYFIMFHNSSIKSTVNTFKVRMITQILYYSLIICVMKFKCYLICSRQGWWTVLDTGTLGMYVNSYISSSGNNSPNILLLCNLAYHTDS